MYRKSRIIGYRTTGAPIWLIQGASEEVDAPAAAEDASEQPAGGDADEQPAEEDAPLGPKGEKAFQAEKEKRRAAQAELREWSRLGLTRDEIAKLVAERDKGEQPDPEKLRDQAKTEARAELLRDRVLDKIEAKAAKGFADPEDAAALVLRGRDSDDFLDDGKVDVEAIQEALAELLEKKPYLAAQGRRFQGSADGGARKDARPSQLTQEDLDRMGAEEVVAARKDGRLNNLMGVKK